MKLFDKENEVGIFRGFKQGGLEFHAEIVLPYREDLQTAPMHGQFVLVQLESATDCVLGRITSISSEGRLSAAEGEDYWIRAWMDDRSVPEDIRRQYLKYCIDIRMLGVVKLIDGDPKFVASHRRLPHVGSKVAFLSDQVLMKLCGHFETGAEIGFFALGEFVYSGKDERLKKKDVIKVMEPMVLPKFPMTNLVSRRSFIFARAGFGKSNLNKLLFSSLYKTTPTVKKRNNREVPVGTIIFDVDGEYFWPDDKGRPGLCDVPWLEDRLVVFTSRKNSSHFYQSFVAGDIKLDIRRLKPAEVIAIALSEERQEQQNVRKLKGLNADDWRKMVNEIYEKENNANKDLIMQLLRLENDQVVEMAAARANMTAIVKMLHNPNSRLLDMLIRSLREGKICIIDLSLNRGEQSMLISGILMQYIFEHNQKQFTEADAKTVPTIAVIEEAQAVLGNYGNSTPYVSWVKEGRKYDLGAVMITQQPGSIASELLSQGDNWFVFHLLSANDLMALKRANAHFSDDILSSLLNEPLVGNCVFWSSVTGMSYPIPIKTLSFEEIHKQLDQSFTKPAGKTYAIELKNIFAQNNEQHETKFELDSKETNGKNPNENKNDIDYFESSQIYAIDQIVKDEQFMTKLREDGQAWGKILEKLKGYLPPTMENREKIASNLVKRMLDETFGPEHKGWRTEKKMSQIEENSHSVLYVYIIQNEKKTN
jgi:uncharacterized protein